MAKDASAKPRVSLPVFLLGAVVLIGAVYAISPHAAPEQPNPAEVAVATQPAPKQTSSPATPQADAVAYDPALAAKAGQIAVINGAVDTCAHNFIRSMLATGERSRSAMEEAVALRCTYVYVRMGVMSADDAKASGRVLAARIIDQESELGR